MGGSAKQGGENLYFQGLREEMVDIETSAGFQSATPPPASLFYPEARKNSAWNP